MPSIDELPRWLFASDPEWRPGFLKARWLFMRALGFIFFSAFFSLLFQIRGLIGPDGLLPADEYLKDVAQYFDFGLARFWAAPTLYWFSSSDRALLIVVWIGIAASVLLMLNLWPRATTFICLVAFLAFISAAQDFSSYQSDGMLLEAGFLCLFFAPPGLRPGLGRAHPPSRVSWFLLVWLNFRIYFESGIAKILSHDPQWHGLTAMDQYYQNGPLPTWIGWYVQHLPHKFHATVVVYILAVELVLAFLMFLPRKFRIVLFFIITPMQISIILTANYAFLNYIVLALGILLLDDRFLDRFWRARNAAPALPESQPVDSGAGAAVPKPVPEWRAALDDFRFYTGIPWLVVNFYVTATLLVLMVWSSAPLPIAPVRWLEPFRVANEFGLFASMTPNRYEIEFQGSADGKTWTAYSFRYKPQDISSAPRIYAPYQPRFDWNLWFASLGFWREYPFVLNTEERLLEGSPDVLALFANNPFPNQPPLQVRAVRWQYWFTDRATKRSTGQWWRRQLIGLYAPVLEREPDGKYLIVDWPGGASAAP
ncbi:MAG: lipase maturation factor family protein [Candidatus Acidiferrales bacterium]